MDNAIQRLNNWGQVFNCAKMHLANLKVFGVRGRRGGGGAGGVVGGWVEVFIIFLKCSHFCELCVF